MYLDACSNVVDQCIFAYSGNLVYIKEGYLCDCCKKLFSHWTVLNKTEVIIFLCCLRSPGWPKMLDYIIHTYIHTFRGSVILYPIGL